MLVILVEQHLIKRIEVENVLKWGTIKIKQMVRSTSKLNPARNGKQLVLTVLIKLSVNLMGLWKININTKQYMGNKQKKQRVTTYNDLHLIDGMII